MRFIWAFVLVGMATGVANSQVNAIYEINGEDKGPFHIGMELFSSGNYDSISALYQYGLLVYETTLEFPINEVDSVILTINEEKVHNVRNWRCSIYEKRIIRFRSGPIILQGNYKLEIVSGCHRKGKTDFSLKPDEYLVIIEGFSMTYPIVKRLKY